MKGRANYEENEPLLMQVKHDRHNQEPFRLAFFCPEMETKTKRPSLRLAVSMIAIIIVVAGICLTQDINGIPIRYQILNYYDNTFGGYGGDSPKFACSGHGVQVFGNRCLCDIGFTGNDCSSQRNTDAESVVPDKICLVFENFGVLESTIDGVSQSNSELAISLVNAGYDVTVLYIGKKNPQFSSVQIMYAEEGVYVTRMPETDVNLGENPLEANSYAVYQYILQSPAKFSHIYFSATSGTGYYTLLAQEQGLLCSNTIFINGIDTLPVETTARLTAGESDFMITDKNSLKLDFFQKKSAELADMNILSSNIIYDNLLLSDWNLNKDKTHILSKPLPKNLALKAETSEKVTEFVFVGSMTHAGGLEIFCDAIDIVISDIQSSKASITFLGSSGIIKDLKSEDYIELRANNWDSFEVSWNIHIVSSLDEITKYMRKSGRLAIIPTLYDPVGAVAQALAHARTPMIVSSVSAVADILSASDKSNIISEPTGDQFASKLKSVLAT
ncbi:hypothetical protein HK100_003686, partial [Physocladia obscura]